MNNTCTYSNHKIAVNQNEYWIQFTATNTTIELITAINGNQPTFNAVHLMQGDCLNPQILATDSSYTIGDTLSFTNTLIAGQNYFLRFDLSSNFLGDFDACIVKSVSSGSITIVNDHGDSVICTYDTNNNSPYLNCPEITLCVGESLCFSAIDFLPSNETMNMLVAAVYGNVGTITNNSDSTIACVNFPTVGSQTIFIFPYDSPIQYDLTQAGGWPYNNYLDPITGDSIGNISWYFNVNVVDQTPPATTNSDGLLCFGDLYTITAFPGSTITSVTVDNQAIYTPNSSSWSISFNSVGQHVIAYTVTGFCYPVTYYDTVNVIQDNALTVTVDACNNATFTFTSCEEFTQIDLLFSNGVQEQVFNFSGTTTWTYNFSGITSPLTWTFNGYQPNPFFPFQPIITYTQTGTIQPASVLPLTISAPLFLCEMTPNAISITSPTGLSTIFWSVTPSTGITGQGTSSITLNTIPSIADVTINVSATDANGCKYTGTVTIENCCQPILTNNEYFERVYITNGINNIINQLPANYYNGPATPIAINLPNPGTLQYSTSYSTPTNLTQFLAANPTLLLGGNVITNNWIFINNDLIVDQSINITNCDFI